jgi:hypothetical protein
MGKTGSISTHVSDVKSEVLLLCFFSAAQPAVHFFVVGLSSRHSVQVKTLSEFFFFGLARPLMV